MVQLMEAKQTAALQAFVHPRNHLFTFELFQVVQVHPRFANPKILMNEMI